MGHFLGFEALLSRLADWKAFSKRQKKLVIVHCYEGKACFIINKQSNIKVKYITLPY